MLPAFLRELAASAGDATRLDPFVDLLARAKRWCSAFDGSARRLQLIWIDKDHPWARSRCWILPKSSLKALTAAGVSILRHRLDPEDQESSDLFNDEHRAADERWCHAKLYAFQRGRARRLLVTSANFSPAAWGAEKVQVVGNDL